MKPKWIVVTCYETRHEFDVKAQMLDFIRRSSDFPMRIEKIDELNMYEKITKGDVKKK
jgi:hypothetical protein